MLVTYLIGSYLLGCVLTAYLVGKSKGVDLRQQNSGNLGARNAGRTFGKGAFVVTMLGDALKGMIVVGIGRYLQLDEALIALGVLLVVMGHVYPFWLSFKGGKGIATGIGSLLVFLPLYFIAFLVGLLVSWPFLKSATLSMIVGFMVYIVMILWIGRLDLVALVAMLGLLIWKHRENIRERVM